MVLAVREPFSLRHGSLSNSSKRNMAHIKLPEGLPGITGPLAAYPETEGHLTGLAQALLQAFQCKAGDPMVRPASNRCQIW